MLRYSYKIVLRELEADILALQIDLLNNPDNERAKKILKDKEQEADWFRKKIENGQDPGVHIL